MTEEKANQIIRCVKECWWRALLVIAIPVFLIALLLRGWPVIVTLEDSMAAWVQAIGSIIAILVAVGLYFLGEYHKQINTKKEEARHVADVMRSVELLASPLVVTMDTLYDKHMQHATEEHLANKDEEATSPFQILNEITGVRVSYEEFCMTRANLIENCYAALSSIDWSRPPVSTIGMHIVSIANEFYFFFNLLRSGANDEDKRNRLRKHAEAVRNEVKCAAKDLNLAYGYQSSWEYIKKPLLWAESKASG